MKDYALFIGAPGGKGPVIDRWNAAAFTCTGHYAVLIMLGIKRVENRSAMPVPAKGRCAVC